MLKLELSERPQRTDRFFRLQKIASEIPKWLRRNNQVGAVLFVLATLVAGCPVIDTSIWMVKNHIPDYIAEYDNRFLGIRQEFPSGGTLGYLSNASQDTDMAAYYMAQYAVAPVVLVRELKGNQFVLGNFISGNNLAVGQVDHRRLAKEGLRIVRDFGNGVVLLRPE